MPYKNISDLPDPIKKHLPVHAQEIYKEVFNNAFKEYKDPKKRRKGSSFEETAHSDFMDLPEKVDAVLEKSGR